MGLGAEEMGQMVCMNKLYFRLERQLQRFNNLEDLYFGRNPPGEPQIIGARQGRSLQASGTKRYPRGLQLVVMKRLDAMTLM